jgi:murein DD-endopeptidase MepM/ murein hydrolase activator NlpD
MHKSVGRHGHRPAAHVHRAAHAVRRLPQAVRRFRWALRRVSSAARWPWRALRRSLLTLAHAVRRARLALAHAVRLASLPLAHAAHGTSLALRRAGLTLARRTRRAGDVLLPRLLRAWLVVLARWLSARRSAGRLTQPIRTFTRPLARRTRSVLVAATRPARVLTASARRATHTSSAGRALATLPGRALRDASRTIIAVHAWRIDSRPMATKLRDRRVILGLATTMIIMSGLGVLTTALIGPGRQMAPAAMALADAAARQQMADRAGRSDRPAPATPAPPKPAPKKKSPTWVNPMPGVELSSCFGPRWGSLHQGIDFAGAPGTPILAVGSGTVFGAGWLYSGYGMSVVIDHGNGYFSHYAHASQILVSPGQHVKPGQPVALEGDTGDSAGPHLHFEIHEGLWNQIDPAPWLRARGVDVGC